MHWHQDTGKRFLDMTISKQMEYLSLQSCLPTAVRHVYRIDKSYSPGSRVSGGNEEERVDV